jgi:hypothetical protein
MSYYFVQSFNVPRATFSLAELNNRGDIVGAYKHPNGEEQSFLMDREGRFTYLDFGTPVAVNDHRQVVSRKALYEDGHVKELVPGMNDVFAEGITNSGTVFGSVGDRNAFYKKETESVPSYVPNLGLSVANGCSDNGDTIVVGQSENKPFIFKESSGNPILLDDKYVAAKDVNSNGVVIGGYSEGSSTITQHGFISDADGRILKELNFNAMAISNPIPAVNSQYQIVGMGDSENAVLLDFNGNQFKYYDLNQCIAEELIDGGWHLTKAIGLNDQGMIIAEATYRGVDKGAFVLSPMSLEIHAEDLPQPYLVESLLAPPGNLRINNQ